MRVFVLVAIRHDPHVFHPPSVWHLQQCARRTHARSFRATSAAFLHTRDALFQTLHRVSIERSADHYKSSNNHHSALHTTGGAPIPHFWFFSALLDVGGNEEEVEVVSMILADLCRGCRGAAAHVEVCRTARHENGGLAPSPSTTTKITATDIKKERTSDVLSLVEREEVLLVQLADIVEANARTQDAFLRRWGVDSAWDYTQALQGRCWWGETGYVALLPKDALRVVNYFLSRELSTWSYDTGASAAELTLTFNVDAVFATALEGAIVEKTLTDSLNEFFDTQVVAQRLYDGAFHQTVVAVPLTVALFITKLPSQLLHDCVLFHTHYRPLFPSGRRLTKAPKEKLGVGATGRSNSIEEEEEEPVVFPAACQNLFLSTVSLPQNNSQSTYDVAIAESQQLAELLREYDVLLSNKGAVRVPLPSMSRYVFTLLLCQCELPSTLMAPFIRRHATVIAEMRAQLADKNERDDDDRVPFTEEEIVLGMKVTWAVQRWTAALRTATAESSCPYALWENSLNSHSDAYRRWVRDRMQSAQYKAKKLNTRKEERNGESAVSLDNTTLLNNAQRSRTLCKLERSLFAPRLLAFRGSSTDWLVSAVREVGEQYAQVPTSLMAAEAVSAKLSADHVRSLVKSSMRSSSGAAASAFRNEEGSETSGGSSDPDEEENHETQDDRATASVEALDAEDAETLQEQINELEEALQQEVQHVSLAASCAASMEQEHNMEDAAVAASDKAIPWMLKEEVVTVTQNELFLNHVQLFGAELARK